MSRCRPCNFFARTRLSVRGGTVRPMTVIDPATVDWQDEDDSMVGSAACGGVSQAIAEGLRRGLWAEGEEPPHPLAGWVPSGETVGVGWVVLRPPEDDAD